MIQRKEAVLRGLRFIYQNALEGDNFEDWGGDYLWCFHCIASTSADEELRALAREMGSTLARRWQGEQQTLPELADADEVGYYMSMIDVSSRLGIDNPQLREHVQQGSRRFTARDYLGFNPVQEAPPAGGERSRYDLWCDALVLTYAGDGCGIPMGASYVDVLRWLPEMRPYRGPEGGANLEFRDTVYAITHLVYTLNDYSRYRLSPEWLRQEFEFLCENLNVPVAAGDAELLGEFVDCLRAFGLPESDGVVSAGVEYLLASQNADGSWGDVDEPDVHTRYHTAWTAIDGLREYQWSERTEWPAGVREVLVGAAG
jgi:Prenyltransferase and squalene oxidase repeat